MIKAALYMAALYLVYSLLLSRDTLYRRNRAFILFSVMSAFILPLITILTNRPVNIFFGKTLTEVLITGTNSGSVSAVTGNNEIDSQRLVLLIYLTGLVIFITKLIIDLSELTILIVRNKKRSHIIRFSGLNTSGFSALGQVFINSALSEEDAEEIKRHEQNHLDHYHFLDIIFIEIIKAFQWFNPFVHLFDRSLRAVHEFQADEGCLRTGMPVINYQRLIMSQVFKSKAFTATNSFSNPTLIKKRMIMMTKERSRMLANLKLLMVLPVIAVVMIAFSSCKGKAGNTGTATEEIAPPPPQADADKKVVAGQPIPTDAPPPPPPPPPYEIKNGDTLWVYVDQMPLFKGGDAELLKFIAENTTYPESAKENKIQGKVIVGFLVSENGSISNVKIEKGVDPALDAEALRVVKSLPAFEKPGINNGKPVAVWYKVPITFTLH
jgi:TonB family protein